MQTKFNYPMNVVAKDSVSGFEGIIIARNAHLFGCAQYGIAPQELASDGTPKKTEYFDESRIEIVDDSKAVHGEDEYQKIYAIPLGTEVQDKVSGFRGKVLVVIENLHNCNQYWVEPPVDKDGKPRDGQWYDEGRLSVVGKGIAPEEVAAPKRGSVFSRDLPR
ncbi:hypothetical protein [Paenibacillus cremeus]|uniref:Uncharacterized protein n=1 Tax=Paenibacillus cremeus TaxID=2163881 RepID=A0A559KCQ6_9BACL|nr:hypothetical protein [Paenibacillus cremeus]TVY09911.1 hypothetical protein FPZ49_11105 [Paenibacillus cremeus]